MTPPSALEGPARGSRPRALGSIAALATGLAVWLVVLGLAVGAVLNPAWIGFAQGRAGAPALTGLAPDELAAVTGELVADLVLGPPAFDVALGGVPLLDERERAHMRDVRGVFAGFTLLVIAAATTLALARLAARGPSARAALARRIGRAAVAFAAVVTVGGIAAILLFDLAFELFHRLLFPPGSYLFDPRTDRLVQLFPQRFWVETTAAVGIVAVGLALLVALVARRRSGERR